MNLLLRYTIIYAFTGIRSMSRLIKLLFEFKILCISLCNQYVMVVRMEIFVCWMGLTTAVVEWSSVMKESGGLCVMITGMRAMLASCADSWAFQLMVQLHSNMQQLYYVCSVNIIVLKQTNYQY